METLLSSFGLVALSEMGDKTQLLAFSLATRFRAPFPILAGILVATASNHALASSLGGWISEHTPARAMTGILALTFIAFGFWTLRPDKPEEAKPHPRLGPFLATTFLFFLAEMGDKTQLATIALAAKYHAPWTVTLGTTLGMMVSDGLAVFLGEKLAERISMIWVRKIAAGLFFGFGILSLLATLKI